MESSGATGECTEVVGKRREKLVEDCRNWRKLNSSLWKD